MRTDKDRELWLQKLIAEQAGDETDAGQSTGQNQQADRGTVVKWGAVAVTGVTAASLISSL